MIGHFEVRTDICGSTYPDIGRRSLDDQKGCRVTTKPRSHPSHLTFSLSPLRSFLFPLWDISLFLCEIYRTKWNQMKPNGIKWNQLTSNDIKWNEMKSSDLKWSQVDFWSRDFFKKQHSGNTHLCNCSGARKCVGKNLSLTCHGAGTMAKAEYMPILCTCECKISISRNTCHVKTLNSQIYKSRDTKSTHLRIQILPGLFNRKLYTLQAVLVPKGPFNRCWQFVRHLFLKGSLLEQEAEAAAATALLGWYSGTWGWSHGWR